MLMIYSYVKRDPPNMLGWAERKSGQLLESKVWKASEGQGESLWEKIMTKQVQKSRAHSRPTTFMNSIW